MSVEARIKQLQEQERRLEEIERKRQKQKEEEDQKKLKIYWERREEELPQALKAQDVSYQKLRRSGVVKMFEDYTGIDLPKSLDPEKQPGPLSKEELERLTKSKAWRDRVHRVVNAEWRLSILSPNFSQDYIWDSDVVLLASKVRDSRYRFTQSGDGVTVRYSAGNILTISGEEQTFSDILPSSKSNGLDEVETALARAFMEPKKGEDRYARLNIHREIFVGT